MNTKADKPTLIFDVNETLLDMAPLRSSVARVLGGDKNLASLWFSTLLHQSVCSTVYGQFHDFGNLGRACLRMVAKQNNIPITEKEAREALRPMLQLPPHPDVAPALANLRNGGYSLATLTNSSVEAMKQQLNHAEIFTYFDQTLSVEQVGLYKPHPRVYQWAAAQLGSSEQACRLVAAHGWDVAGAASVGMQTAFIARAGQGQMPMDKPLSPSYTGLINFANKILE